MTLSFQKMAGAGNDFIVLDNRVSKIKNLSQLAKRWCDRKNSIGGDGLIALEKSTVYCSRIFRFPVFGLGSFGQKVLRIMVNNIPAKKLLIKLFCPAHIFCRNFEVNYAIHILVPPFLANKRNGLRGTFAASMLLNCS